MARKLEVEIVGDASSLKRALGQADNSATKTGGAFSGLAKKGLLLGGAAGLGAVALGAKKAVSAASDLNESINAVKVVFGPASRAVLNFSKQADKIGLSMREFNQLVTPIGASLKNYGFSADAAAKQSIKLAKRAADMASVFNVDVGEALGAIQAGLRGEADPLERFGVGLTEAALKAKALQMGMKLAGGELTAQQKTQARLALIYEQTNKVQGDFANTSDSLANQQRILKAQFENVAATVGQKLIPIMSQGIAWLSDHWPEIKAKIMDFWAAAKPALVAFGELITSIVALFREHWGTIGPLVEKVGAIIQNNLEGIAAIFRFFAAVLKGDWSAAWEELKNIVSAIFDNIKGIADLFKTVVTGIMSSAGTALKNAFVSAVKGIAGAAWGVISGVGDKITGLLGTIKGWGKDIGVAVKNAAVTGVTGIAADVWAVIDNIGGAITKAASTITGWGKDVGAKLKDGAVAALTGLGAAIVAQVKAAVNALIGRVNDLLSFSFQVDTHIPGVGKKGFTVDAPDIPRLAKGTRSFAGGLAIVGERGPELVGLPGGSSVTPNGSFGRPMVVNLQMDGRTMASLLIDPLRNEVQQLRRAGGAF